MVNVCIFAIALNLFIAFSLWLLSMYWGATQKHRNEWGTVHWFIGTSYCETPVSIPRAFCPLINCLRTRWFGFCLSAVRVIVQNHNKQILCCQMESKRCSRSVTTDLGAGGMVPTNTPREHAAIEEVYEELGINVSPDSLRYAHTLTPAHGVTCLLHVYWLTLRDDVKFQSKDGTYVGFRWVSKTENVANLRSDAAVLLSRKGSIQ